MGARIVGRTNASDYGGTPLVKKLKKAVKKVAPKRKVVVKKPMKIKKAAPKKSMRKPVKKVAVKKTVAKKAKSAKVAARTSRAKERTKARAALAQRLANTPVAAPVEERKPIPKYPLVQGADSERVRTLIPLLREAVRKRTITDWRINLAHTRSANLYLGQELVLEDDQRAVREDVILTVYRRDADGLMGEAQVPIVKNDPDSMRDAIAVAADLASVARKPAFSLPEPVEGLVFPHGYDMHMLEAFLAGDGGKVPRAVLEDLRTQVALVRDVKLAAAEILASTATIRVVNSNGVDVSFHRTGLLIDITFTSKGKTDEQEFHWMVDVVSPDQLDLRNTIPREAQRARDALVAASNTGFVGGVLLSGEALRDYVVPSGGVGPILLHAHARLKAMGVSRLALGEKVGHFNGEPFTISSNPALPLGAFSMPVDEEGVALTQYDIVRTGVFSQWVAGPRYAAELKVPLTGNVANVYLHAGATREEHLRGNAYLEIVSFSWFNPDMVSGDYSAEIRLGYLWQNGRSTPIRGGHLVGNVFKDLCDARFSREVMQSGRYYGPRTVLLRNGTVTRGA